MKSFNLPENVSDQAIPHPAPGYGPGFSSLKEAILNLLANRIDFKEKSPCFDFIRGMAVLLVLFSHLDNYFAFYLWPLSSQPLQGHLGQLGVHLFFILSGILIWKSADALKFRNHWLRIYCINRFTRIYPIYIFCIAFIVITSQYFVGVFRPEITTETVLRHLFFTQSLAPPVNNKLNGPFWTLTYEAIFYVLVPILIAFRTRASILISSVIITQILLFHEFTILNSFSAYWLLFVAGILVVKTNSVLKPLYAAVLIWLGIFLVLYLDNNKLGQFLIAIGIASILLNFNFNGKLSAPVKFMGLISYSAYIWHWLLLHLVMPYFPTRHYLIYPSKPFFPVGVSYEGIFMIGLIMIVSYLSYRLIEKPWMTNIRLKLSSRY